MIKLIYRLAIASLFLVFIYCSFICYLYSSSIYSTTSVVGTQVLEDESYILLTHKVVAVLSLCGTALFLVKAKLRGIEI